MTGLYPCGVSAAIHTMLQARGVACRQCDPLKACPACNGLGFVIVTDSIDTGNDAYCPTVEHPDYCPAKCCGYEESEARFKDWEKGQAA